MAEYIVEIGDERGKSFKMLIGTASRFSGIWRTLDKGFICYIGGFWYLTDPNDDLDIRTTLDLRSERTFQPISGQINKYGSQILRVEVG